MKRYMFGILKIDRTIVARPDACPDDAAIVVSTVSLAPNLGLKVTTRNLAIGEQLACLRQIRLPSDVGLLLRQAGEARQD